MNRYAALALVFGASVSAFAFAQERFRYTDPSGNILVLATDAGMDNVNGTTTKLDLSGKVDITSASQGLHLTADHVTCIVAEVKAAAAKSKAKKELQSATAKGNLHVTKTVSNANGKQTTDITGSEGQIDSKPAGSVVTLKGPVTLKNLDETKRSTMTATGSSAVATLEPGDKSKLTNGLVAATLQGPVTMDLIETAAAGSSSGAHANGTADRMEISRSGTGSTVRLTGHVEIHGSGGSRIGNASGLSSATFELNAAGEVRSFKMKAGSGALLASTRAGCGPEQQGVLELQSQPGLIRVKGYSTFSSDLETGETLVEGNGGLVTVEDTGKGMTLTAPTMSCKILKDAKGISAVMKANMSGGSNVTFDSEIADRTAAEYAKSKGYTADPKGSKAKDVIKSQSIDYVRDGLDATLTFANPFNWQNATLGVDPSRMTYKQDTLTEGNYGVVKFAWGTSDLTTPQFSPQSVHIAGNVHFHTERLETPTAPALPKLTKYDATGKTFDAIFEQANTPGGSTITLAEDVKLTREVAAGTDTYTGTKVVITLKPGQLVPVRYEAFGDLARANIKTPIQKGGRK